MSEMFRPAPPPAAPDHERHDPLLVAQLAAGDPLDQARRREAQRWLETCSACAGLAADLRAVSAAVAAEPMPPRRRDFRLTPEQAESLQGNVLARALRRFSAPRARGFAPAAAGILSLGLVFMVAGYAWPDAGTVPVGTDAVPVPAAAQPSFEAATESVVPPAGAQRGQVAPVTESRGLAADEEAPAATDDAVTYFSSEQGSLEGLAEHQAGDSASSKATAEEAEAAALELVERAPEQDTSMTGPETQDTSAAAPDLLAADSADRLLADSEAAASEMAMSAAVDGGDSDEVGTVMSALEEDAGLGPWLVLVGVVLALSGGGLLLLGWLSRRSRDPLLGG